MASHTLRHVDLRRNIPREIPRICLLAETFHPVLGGSENHARLLASRLNAMGMSTFVLTRRADRSSPLAEIVDGVSVYRYSPAGMGRWGKFAGLPFMHKELETRRDDYDVLYVCALRVTGASAVRIAHEQRKICVLRAETNGEMSGDYASAYRKLPIHEKIYFKHWLKRRNALLKQADAYIGITELVTDEFENCGMDPKRIFHIPNGIDTDLFRPANTREKINLREKLHLPITDTLVLFTGRLIRGKGVEYLLDAWQRIASKRKGIHLVLVGSGSGEQANCEDELRSFVIKHGLQESVTFAGWAEKVYEYLQACDLFVFPTEYEGFGLSLVEAMACRLPVIASNVGGIPKIIHHPEDGILVEPKNPDVLERQMIRVLDDHELAESLAANAHRTANEHYSIDIVAKKHFELFSYLHSSKLALGE